MPVTYRYEPDRLCVVCFQDPVTFEEWQHAVDEALADPEYSPEVRVVSDRRASTAPDSGFIHKIARMVGERPEIFRRHPVAIVVSGANAAAFGMGRMQEMLSESAQVRVRTFYDYDLAVAWLNGQTSGC